MRLVLVATLLFLGVSVAEGGVDAGKCGFESQAVIDRAGNNIDNGINFDYTSRVEKIDDLSIKYFWCICNWQKYDWIKYLWYNNLRTVFQTSVRPNNCLPQYSVSSQTYSIYDYIIDYGRTLGSQYKRTVETIDRVDALSEAPAYVAPEEPILPPPQNKPRVQDLLNDRSALIAYLDKHGSLVEVSNLAVDIPIIDVSRVHDFSKIRFATVKINTESVLRLGTVLDDSPVVLVNTLRIKDIPDLSGNVTHELLVSFSRERQISVRLAQLKTHRFVEGGVISLVEAFRDGDGMKQKFAIDDSTDVGIARATIWLHDGANMIYAGMGFDYFTRSEITPE